MKFQYFLQDFVACCESGSSIFGLENSNFAQEFAQIVDELFTKL